MTHRYYSPSQLKKMFNSCCSRKMQVALSAPNFPKCIMRDVLESETPRFVAGYYANAKSIESMAQMLNHPAFSDNEVSELLALNPALDVLSLYSERVPEALYNRLLNRVIDGEYSDGNVSFMAQNIVNHRAFPWERADAIIAMNNASLLAEMGQAASCDAVLIDIVAAVPRVEDKTLHTNIYIKVAENAACSRSLFNRLLALEIEPNSTCRIRIALLDNHEHTMEQFREVLAYVQNNANTDCRARYVSDVYDAAFKNADMKQSDFIELVKCDASQYGIDEGFHRLNFSDAQAEAMLLEYQGSCDALCYAILDRVDTLSPEVVSQFIEREPVDSLLVRKLLSSGNVPSGILDMLAYDPDHTIQMRVAMHPNVSDSTFKCLYRVRESIMSSNKDYDKTLFNESPAFALLTSLKNYLILHNDYGYDLFDFKSVNSPKAMTKMLIGSKHPQEVQFLFDSQEAESLTALSALQSVFTNSRGKLDRHGYIQFLAQINSALGTGKQAQKRAGLAIDAPSLRTCLAFLSHDEMVAVVMDNAITEARDVFRMLATLIARDCPDESAKQCALVRKWLASKKDYGEAFHSYLSNKQQRDFSISTVNARFYQADAIAQLDTITESLPSHVTLTLPEDTKALRALGRAQHHCVGTRYYADRCTDGSAVIFALSTGNRSDETFTYQFERSSGRLAQAKGFSNSDTPPELNSVAYEVFNAIKDACEAAREQAALPQENE